jgi:small glutamine-rich tetratricopeptide repeat-containing protein alpha
MGKKKTINKNNPDALKEAGNKAFSNRNFEEAAKQYTMAIEITLDAPNHIYFANRANCFLELASYEECIVDCNRAIEIDPTFSKSYYRKAKALVNQQKLTDAMETLKQGIEQDPENEIIRDFMKDLAEEIE